jgi:DNA-binding NarL/FixJ family response regulator
VLDIAMPQMNGEQVVRELRDRCPEVKIIALSGYTDQQFVRAMTKAGAKGYVVKAASAVMTLWQDSSPQAGGSTLQGLGRREKEVLKLIAEGHRSAMIAAEMGIAVATVEAHRRNILRKLHLHSVADLTRYAARHGLVTV